MTETNNPYFTIASIVDQACIDLDVPVSHYFQKFLSWAKWNLMELKMDTANEVKTVRLDISDVCTVTLPGDFIDWTKIGIESNQYVTCLSANESLSNAERTLEAWNPTNDPPPGWLPTGTAISTRFYNFGGNSLYAAGSGLPHNSHYKIVDREHGVKEMILDSGLDATEIYLEYIASGLNVCGDTLVHPYLKEYVRAAIHHEWEKFQKPPLRSESAIERTGRALWHQQMVCRGRTNSIDPATLLTISRKSYRLTNHA
jgi:hypothetical protein